MNEKDKIKIRVMLENLIGGNALNMKEFKFRVEQMPYVIHRLEVQTSTPKHEAILTLIDVHGEYHIIGV
jgi:hypothetical protein